MMGKKNKSFQQKKWNEKLVSKTLLALSWNVPIKLLEHHPESTWTFFTTFWGRIDEAPVRNEDEEGLEYSFVCKAFIC